MYSDKALGDGNVAGTSANIFIGRFFFHLIDKTLVLVSIHSVN